MELYRLLFALIFIVIGVFGQNLPEGDFEEGVYAVKYQDKFLSAFDAGSRYANRRIGLVTAEEWKDTQEQIWSVKKELFFPDQGPNQLYTLRTMGPNNFNFVDFEPFALGYPVWHEFRFTPVKIDGHFLIHSQIRFDWGNIGENACLERQGESVVDFALCDAENTNQHWEFEPILMK